MYENNIASKAVAVTTAMKSDSTDLTSTMKGLYIGGDGDLKVVLVGDTVAVTFVGLVASTFLPIAVRRIWSTGTSATNIVGFL